MRVKRTFLARIQHRIRVGRLNKRSGIQIDPSIYIARSARIQIDADGFVLGGRVLVSEWVTISDGVIIAPYGGSVEIGAHAYIGPYCVLFGPGGLVICWTAIVGDLSIILHVMLGITHLLIQSDVYH